MSNDTDPCTCRDEDATSDLAKHKRVIDTLSEMVERRDKRLAELEAIIRRKAGYPPCSTCDGGGCPDCTDPA